MKTLVRLSIFVVASVALPAVAAEPFIEGVYLESRELCDQAKKNTLQTVIEAGNWVLTSKGFDAIEYNCTFLQVMPVDGRKAWVATAFCEEPGVTYPDTVSLFQRAAGELEVTSLYDSFLANSVEDTAPQAAPDDETARASQSAGDEEDADGEDAGAKDKPKMGDVEDAEGEDDADAKDKPKMGSEEDADGPGGGPDDEVPPADGDAPEETTADGTWYLCEGVALP